MGDADGPLMTFPGSTTFPGAGTFPTTGVTEEPDTPPPPSVRPITPITWTVDGWPGGCVDAAGIEWLVYKDEGWWDAPAPRVNQTPRAFGHGSHRARAYTEARVITLQGAMTAPTLALGSLAAQQFAGLLADGDLHELVVTDGVLGSLSCLVERAAQPKFARVNRTQADFQLQLVAPDPRKFTVGYTPVETPLPVGGSRGLSAASGGVSAGAPGAVAVSPSSPGSVSVTNIGTAPAGPVLELVGPLTTPVVSIAETGVRFVYQRDVPLGVSLWINTDSFPALGLPARSVLLDGTSDRRRYLSLPSGWPEVPPGGTATFTVASPSYHPASRLRVHLRSAWW